MQTFQIKPIPLAPVDNPLAPYSQSMHQHFTAMLAQPDMDAELDVSTTEQANLLRYLESPAREPERPLREKIQALLLQLKPVAHLFADGVREELLHQVDGAIKITEQTLSPLNGLVKTIHDSLPWASLEPRVLHPLERLREYYEMAYQNLITDTPRTRIQWLTWKAQLSIPSVGHYLISVNTARQLLCRDELGQTVKRNNEGNHAVIFRDGLVFKPNPQVEDKADPIEPGMEHAVVAWHQLLANSADSAASTEIIKLRQVPFRLETGATILEGGVVQCGLMIRGILLLDMLILQETIQHWVNRLGQPVVEALLPEVLSDIRRIASQNKLQSQTIEQTLKAFCAYCQSLSPEQGMSGIEALLNKPQLFSDAVMYIQSKGGLPTLQSVFAWCQAHPELMHGQDMGDALGWLEGFKVLCKLNPSGFTLSPKDQIETSLHWGKRLNLDNVTAMALTSLLTCPTDGKGDNYMVTFQVDAVTHLPHNFHIIGIDSDRALLSGDVPLEGITCRPGMGKNVPPVYWPDLNCVFLVLQDVLSLPASQTIVNHLLSKTPLQWVETWLSSILYKTQQWQAWQALKILVPDDIAILKDEMKIKRLDIPVHLPTQLMDELLSRLERMQRLFQDPDVSATLNGPNPLTVKDVFFALEPILAAYYEALMLQFPHQPLKAHERIHKPFDRKYGGQLEVSMVLASQLQVFVPQLAVLAAPLSLQHNTTLSVLLNYYQIQQKNAEQNSPIEHLADHLAASTQSLFTENDFTNKNQIHLTLQRLEALGCLGATQCKLSEGNMDAALLAHTIHHAVQFAYPGALRLLLLERARRLAAHEQSPTTAIIHSAALHHLNDSEGRTLWHEFFNHLHSIRYAHHLQVADHITVLLAGVVANQINTRDTEGRLAIFNLLRTMHQIPEQAEMVLSRIVGLGLDFTLMENNQTPLDYALQLCLDNSERPPLKVVTLLLRYGAGRAMSFKLAGAFFKQFPTMGNALNQLKQQNRLFAWYYALNTLTASVDIAASANDGWLIEGINTGKRYLSSEMVETIRQHQATLDVLTLTLHHQGEHLNLTILPELSSVDDAAGQLYRHFFNYGLPETELFRFPPINPNQPQAVLFSQTLIGENLQDVLNHPSAAAKLSQLDAARFTELVIMHLLTNLKHSDEQDYQWVSFVNTEGQTRYVIVPIHTGQAFIEPCRVETDKRTKNTVRWLQLKTIIYCLDAMRWPLDMATVQKFVRLSVSQKLTAWLTELMQTEQAMNALFNHPDRTIMPEIRMTGPFGSKQIARLYDKTRRLQQIFQKHLDTQLTQPMLSGLEVLNELEPIVGHYYDKAFAHSDSPKSRFFYLANGLYNEVGGKERQSILLLSGSTSNAEGPTQQEHGNPARALVALKQVRQEHNTLETVKSAVQAGNIKALDVLLLDSHKQQVILGIDITLLKPDEQQALWVYLTDNKVPLAFEKLEIKGSPNKHIETMTDDILKKLLKQSPHLRELHLACCPYLTEASLGELGQFCSGIMRVKLDHLPQLKRLADKKNYLLARARGGNLSTPLAALRVLEILDCPGLQAIDIQARLLRELFISNTPGLSYCKTQSEHLRALTLQHCNRLLPTEWPGLVSEPSYTSLNNVTLVCDTPYLKPLMDLVNIHPILWGINWDINLSCIGSDELKKLLDILAQYSAQYPRLAVKNREVLLGTITTIVEKITKATKPVTTSSRLGLLTRNLPLDRATQEIVNQLLAYLLNEHILEPIVLPNPTNENIARLNEKLQLSVKKNALADIDRLVALGANLYVKTSTGKGLLHVAAENEAWQAFDQLLAKGLSYETEEGQPRPLVHIVAEHKQLIALDALLQQHPTSINSKNANGATVLHKAIATKDNQFIAALLERGSDPSIPDASGNTPLHMAIQHSEKQDDQLLQLLILLVKKGANYKTRNLQGMRPIDQIKSRKLAYALEEAHRYSKRQTMQQLVSRIRFLDEQITRNEKHAKGQVGLNDKRPLSEEQDLQERSDEKGNTLLHLAIKQHKSMDYVRSLMEKGADYKARNKAGERPVDLADKAMRTFMEQQHQTLKGKTQKNLAVKLQFLEQRVTQLKAPLKEVPDINEANAYKTKRPLH